MRMEPMQFCSRSDIPIGTLEGHKDAGREEKKIRGCKKQVSGLQRT
jgi:hypothetical protein